MAAQIDPSELDAANIAIGISPDLRVAYQAYLKACREAAVARETLKVLEDACEATSKAYHEARANAWQAFETAIYGDAS